MRPALIVTLDRTLIATSSSPDMISDFVVQNGTAAIYVSKRPFLDEFLAGAVAAADIYLHSTLDVEVTQQIVAFLDPLGTFFKDVGNQSGRSFGRRPTIVVETETDFASATCTTLISLPAFECGGYDYELKAALEEVLSAQDEMSINRNV
jgi:hypothetical protein